MKPKTVVITAIIVLFLVGTLYALLREFNREEAEVGRSISGIVEVEPSLYAQGVADIVRTDRIVLFLIDPASGQPVAMATDTPLVPPQNIRIGEMHGRTGEPLEGPYLVVGITDKDGEIFKVSPGEVYGITPQPVALGTEGLRLVLTQPFRGSLTNQPGPAMATAPMGPPTGSGGGGTPGGMGAPAQARPLDSAPPDPKFSVQGTINVAQALKSNVTPQDRLIIMLFDPQMRRPVAFKIIPHIMLPQKFSVTLPPEAQATAQKAYDLRVFTDKNNSPFEPAPGELAGRSQTPIPLGTVNLDFTLDQPYTR